MIKVNRLTVVEVTADVGVRLAVGFQDIISQQPLRTRSMIKHLMLAGILERTWMNIRSEKLQSGVVSMPHTSGS